MSPGPSVKPEPRVVRPGARILGTGHFLPPQVRTNLDLEKLVETSDTWIRERTGIRERRVAPDGTGEGNPARMVTSDMAAEAAKNALAAAGLTAKDIDMIIVGTVTPDMPMPATAAFVQQKLGAPNCPAFDISAACAGFIYGLSIADNFIRNGQVKHVLVIGVELLSRVVDWTDRTTCVLFGDGAGAMVLGPPDGSDRGILGTQIFTDGSLARSLMIPAGGSETPVSHGVLEARENKVKMKGQDIFKAAVRNLYSASQGVVDQVGMTNDQVDWVCPHQANLRIIDQVVQRANYQRERVLSNIERVGNTSSASIPILIDENVKNGKIKPGHVVLMCALGAGVSWGSALVRM
jgi:3-oxoacyl-[acyl-carrier-protein] synthase-3